MTNTLSNKTEFKREERYIVIKRKHLHPITEASLRNTLNELGVGTVECVVVESDWPEYETVWRMIEERVAGRTTQCSGDTQELADGLEELLALDRWDDARIAHFVRGNGETLLSALRTTHSPSDKTVELLKTEAASAVSHELTDVEIEDALTSEGIRVWGPDGERFERMFSVVMKARAARIDSHLGEMK